ncbi:amino acid adenylation domain-containing protein [Wukongibacter sp. M2B1]|uniref:amino acid adenylation domain-containing protein n=1 Tax=Wukongibacter sp. M2B1 TaxID=3088895 RepID=UPI003D7AC916
MQDKITQNILISSEKLNKEKEYWKNKINENSVFADIPFDDFKLYRNNTYNNYTFTIPQRIYQRMRELSNSSKHGMYTIFVTAVSFIVYKYCGHKDMIIGTPIFKQSKEGMLSNDILALRCRLEENIEFKDYLLQIWNEISDSNKNMGYPVEAAILPYRKQDSYWAVPLFGIMVEFSDIHQKIENVSEKCNLLFRFESENNGIKCEVVYNSHIYCNETIKLLNQHFINYLEVVTTDKTKNIWDIELVRCKEKERLLFKFNRTDLDYDKTKTLHQVFEERADRYSEEVAVTYSGENLSYRELNEKSNRLARALMEEGVQSKSIVTIMLERTDEMIAAILAVLKTGGICLPIDNTYPVKRIQYIIDNSKTNFIIGPVNNGHQYNFKGKYIQYNENDLEKFESSNMSVSTKADEAAYIIYTSGTTGKPKGVLLSHQGVINHAFTKIKELDISKGDIVAQNLSINFVASIWQIFTPLFIGGRLIVYGSDVVNDAYRLMEETERDGITILEVVPSLLNSYLMLLESGKEQLELGSLKRLVLTGEKTDAELIKRFYSRYRIQLVNAYGQSECSDDTLHYEVPYDTDISTVPIGKPSCNTRIYILDSNKRLQPIGIAGEMYISGDGVALGYVNEPKLTEERFVPNPYEKGEVMYRTGDIARWMTDGNVEYMGRRDRQLKIRGYRIEPDEIEKCMLSHEWIKGAAVVDSGEGSDGRYICGYIVSKMEDAVSEIREYLSKRLPAYMVPSKILQIEELPRTENGKIDRKALRGLEAKEERKYAAPRNEIERKISRIWEDVLKVDRISIDDNFFELGGNSIKCTMLSYTLKKKLNVDIKVKDIFNCPTIRGIGEYIKSAGKSIYKPIPRAEEREYYPISSAQRRLFMLNALENSQTPYNITGAITLKGIIDRKKLEDTFKTLIRRHEAFRTSFEIRDGELVQCIHEDVDFKITSLEIEKVEKKDDKERKIQEVMSSFIRPFDLGRASLLRVGLIKVDDIEHILIYDMHHIISDGASLRILNREFIKLYNGQELQETTVQYRDFAVWQNEIVGKKRLKKQEKYWIKTFEDEVPVLNLPTDYTRPAKQSFEGDRVEIMMDETIVNNIKEIALEVGATVFMVLLGGLKVLLSKYSGQENIIVGSPALGRPHADVENIIGMFVNTLAIRSKVDSQKSFKDFLEELKKNVLEAYENQEYPFEELVGKLDVHRDMSRNPLFDVMFIVHHIDELDEKVDQLKLRQCKVERDISKFDLTFEVIETDEGMSLGVEYCKGLFKKETIEKMVVCYLEILQTVTASIEIGIKDISILEQEEKKRLLEDFNSTKAEYPKNKTISEVFEEQVKENPDNTAIEFKEEKLNYGELYRRSNQLAGWLRANGIRPGDAVGIMVDRSIEMVVAILGALRAGARCIPMDTTYPEERIRFMAEDSRAKGILKYEKGQYVLKLGYCNSERKIRKHELKGFNIDEVKDTSKADEAAYIIYTSGTTGKPKGVLLSHQGIINHAFTKIKELDISKGDIVAQNLSINFVASIWQIFTPLFIGGRLIVYGSDVVNDAYRLMEETERDGITILEVVPSLLNSYLMLLESGKEQLELGSLRRLVLTGEKTDAELIKRFYSRYRIQLVNAYGQSECSDDTLHYEVPYDTDISTVPIGKPSCNTRIYILDSNRRLQPIGIAGEMYISGDGVALGYVNEPKLTEERFVPNPYEKGEVMYRTGDIARWMTDGNVEYMGRRDRQLKIRGYRIEPDEIEKCMLSHEWIKGAAVVDSGEGSDGRYICGYIVSKMEDAVSEIREYLSKRLPAYMVPSKILQIEELPRTENGKIDRKALRGLEAKEERKYAAPRNEIERKISRIWEDVLKVDRISIDDNFFELGGNSIKCTMLSYTLKKKLNVDIKVKDIFNCPTIRGIGEYIKSAGKSIYKPIPRAEEREYYPISSAQRRLFMLNALENSQTPYNITGAITLKGIIDRKKLEDTFKTLIRRHEAFRTSFEIRDGELVQCIHEDVDFKITSLEIEKVEKKDDKERKIQEVMSSFIRPFDLGRASLLRVGLIKVDDIEHILIYDMHHIISDGASLRILNREFIKLYNGQELQETTVQYRDFAVWQNEIVGKKRLKKQEKYWIKTFEDEVPVLNLPTDYTRPAKQSFEGDRVEIMMDETIVNNIKEIALEVGATVFMVLLGGLKVLLSKYSGQENIIVGSPALGRPHADVENIIGMFVNTLAIRSKVDSQKSFKDFLEELKKNVLEAYENQEYPFEELVGKLDVHRDMSRNPLFDVMFIVHHIDELDEKVDQLKLRQCKVERDISKFDLTFEVIETDEGMSLGVEYCKGLFKKETIEKMVVCYLEILQTVTASIEIGIKDISILEQEEKKRLLEDFNSTKAEYPKNKTISEVFEEQVKENPDNTAIEFKEEKLNYGELYRRSNQLAGWLRANGIRPGDAVGIMVDRSIEMVVAILGALRAGARCIPMDTTYPEERIRFMAEDSRAKGILKYEKGQYVLKLGYCNSERKIRKHELKGFNIDEVKDTSKADEAAYIIYTSGTTGKPKGVLLSHQGIINHAFTKIKELDISKGDIVAQNLSINFVASIWQIFTPLFIGGRLIVYGSDVVNDAYRLMEETERDGITILEVVPSLLNSYLMLLESGKEQLELGSLRRLVLTGEKTDAELIKRFYSRYRIQLVNAYGQSECSDDTLHYEVPYDTDISTVPIGKPSCNTRIYILDSNRRLQPIGIAGEMYISGDGVALGYVNEPKLTEERFVPNPYEKGEVMYRTGDIARWMTDGNVEYMGRRDRQLKIRGYRIEPDEIEKCMLSHEWIKGAAVVDSGEGSDGRYICGYIVSKMEDAVSEIREYLSKRLPAYMVPSKILQIEELPRTENGKIDRKALRGLEAKEERKYAAPRNEIERKISRIWEDVLKVDRISIDDNFFELGGNSISVFNLTLYLEKIGIKIKALDIFKYPTVRALSSFIEGDSGFKVANKEKEQDIETKNGILLRRMEPFNDIFYKNCFYNSLFPVLRYFNLSIMSILINDIIIYEFQREKGDIIQYIPTRNIEKVIEDMNIEVSFKKHSDNIIEDIITALDVHKPVIIWIDCYYSPIRRDEYKKKHLAHTLLIYGYDESKKVFYTIEHTNQYSFNYRKRLISYSDLANGFYGFQRYYNREGFNAYYDFSYRGNFDLGRKELNESYIKDVFKCNFEENKEKIYSGLESIKQFREYFSSICKSEETFFNCIEEAIGKINSVINAKKVEVYRNNILFNDLKGPVKIMESILEQWILIRMTLMKLDHFKSYDKNHLDICLKQFTQIYCLEYMYNDILESYFEAKMFSI